MSNWALKFSRDADEKKRKSPPDIQLRLYQATDLICKNPEIGKRIESNEVYIYEDDENSKIHIVYGVDRKQQQVSVHDFMPKIIQKKSATISVFLSYSHEDDIWCERLTEALVPLQVFHIHLWSDKGINPGQRWLDLIREKVFDRSASLLLVSDDFLNSEFICKEELPIFLDRAENQNPAEEPFLLLWLPFARPTTIEKHKLGCKLLQYQALSDLKKPLNKLRFWQVRNTLRELREKTHKAIQSQLLD